VTEDGTPADPGSYDYTRAARDALHFAALFDRFIQNLRRYVGYEVQYFAAIEPQRRLAPHVHVAIRGTITRTELRQVLTATYHQVWWPSTEAVRFDGDQLPIWHEPTGCYLDPPTGELLPTWDEALDAIGPADEPRHVARFGARFDAQGVIAGSKDAARCIGYLTKYLTKHVADCHETGTESQGQHVNWLAAALRYEPCSPGCAKWLRYGIQPKNPRPGLRPGYCKGKAHRREYLGYGGRRVLVSRKWSGKTLADHRADRKAWLLVMLGIPEDRADRYAWEVVTRPTPTTCPCPCPCLEGCCTCWPAGPAGRQPSPKPDAEFRTTPATFRQLGRQRDGEEPDGQGDNHGRAAGDACDGQHGHSCANPRPQPVNRLRTRPAWRVSMPGAACRQFLPRSDG
jgi:hypothetical protein